MDITSFFEFPGILITIGLVLLILSIVLLIIAFKTNDNPIVEGNDDSLKGAPIVNNDNIISKDKILEEKNSEDNVKKNIKNDSDDGFDLTKVFEISPDNGLAEKEVISNKSEINNNSVNKDIDNEEISHNDELKNNDEEIELL